MIQPHELADMRQAADKAPFDVQQKFHALLDAYEGTTDSAKLDEQIEDLKDQKTDAARSLREVYPSSPSKRAVIAKEFGEAPSEDAWQEALEDCRGPVERAEIIDEELTRARAIEAKLRARVEALEDAIESALGELE